MKTSSLLTAIFVAAALVAGSTGCAHRHASTTNIPNGLNQTPTTPPPTTSIPGGTVPSDTDVKSTDQGVSQGTGCLGNLLNNGPHDEDATIFKSDAVYFDFDSATIKKSEEKKLEDVANYFKEHTNHALRVEGNCDERGTEKYNLSLGDRRALAVREYLSNLGVSPSSIVTLSYGASKPLASGHNESAWKQNRRGDLILLKPKQ